MSYHRLRCNNMKGTNQVVTAPYGSWPSPISAHVAVEKTAVLSQVETSGEHVWWCERRGVDNRRVLFRSGLDKTVEEVLPPPYSCETFVHEYGGAAYAVCGNDVFFCNRDDQRVYRLSSLGVVDPITPAGLAGNEVRYADLIVSSNGRSILAVREVRYGDAVQNDLVTFPTDGSQEPRTLVSGCDFFSSPRLSPDAKRLCWLCWNHPLMPWNGTELWCADYHDGVIDNARMIAGGPDESISQPRWSPEGLLHFVSDRSGFWNLYGQGASIQSLAPMQADFTNADWMLGQATYTFLPDGSIVATVWRNGCPQLVLIDPASHLVTPIHTPYTAFSSLKPLASGFVTIASSAHQQATIVTLSRAGGAGVYIRQPDALPFSTDYLSTPSIIEFPSDRGRRAHAIFYPPTNPAFRGPKGELPPLISMTHGGPTHLAVPVLSTSEEGEDAQGLNIHFWTSRGFAVVDVNYCGSTGFGKLYRDALKGEWGVADVADCVNAARYLVRESRVDAKRLLIRGGSAGGFVALRALGTYQLYTAGASYFGVTDIQLLAQNTHKFESHYFDWLLHPLPEGRELYKSRSPITQIDQIRVPIIIFQGMKDTIVPPEQSQLLASSLRDKGLPFVYKTFEQEGHGFRSIDVRVETLTAELAFYRQVLEISALSAPDERQPADYAGADRSASAVQ
jgi:dipeptidyl aminopeptidase/acylaminoacyl peptidase